MGVGWMTISETKNCGPAGAPPRPRLRRRDPRAPTVDVFAEDGYAGVSIEGVAARAGVGKATIYRRYAQQGRAVVEAIRDGAVHR